MIVFWVVAAIVCIVLGLFVFSQGGDGLGPAIATVGVAILLIIAVSKTL